ncbi:MAG: hypothetical protein WCJ30_19755 [Deltaproteobacteria bacterium]
MRIFGHRTVIEKLRDALHAEVHFGDVGPARGRPDVLWIEGPGALTGVAQRLVVGHERALRRAGFRSVECIGVDPVDPRARQGRLRAVIPDEKGIAWSWELHGGEMLQERIMAGDEGRLMPRALSADEPEGARVLPLAARPKKRRDRK